MHLTTQTHYLPQRIQGCIRHQQQQHQTKHTVLRTTAGQHTAADYANFEPSYNQYQCKLPF